MSISIIYTQTLSKVAWGPSLSHHTFSNNLNLRNNQIMFDKRYLQKSQSS